MHLSPAEYVIHVFGGVRATARALGKCPSNVSKWQKRGYVPSKNIAKIMKVATEMKLDLEPRDLVYGRDLALSELNK